MAKNDIKTKQDGAVLRITLNQPKRGNAVTDDMVRELTKLRCEVEFVAALPADGRLIEDRRRP